MSDTESLSLLRPMATGGRDARAGYRLQDRYAALLVPEFLRDEAFVKLGTELLEDIEVIRREGGMDRCRPVQVKGGAVGPADLREIVAGARTRFGPVAANGALGGFTLAARFPSESVRSLFSALEDVRTSLPHAIPQAAGPTLRDMDDRLSKLGIVADDAEFVRRFVSLDTDFGNLEKEQPLAELIAAKLSMDEELTGGRLVPQLVAAGRELIRSLAESPRRSWLRGELRELVARAVSSFGSEMPPGLLRVVHESFATAASPVSLSERLARLPSVELRLSQMIDRFRPTDEQIRAAVSAMTDSDAPLRNALRRHERAALLYFGFPHVPLAALAGYVVGDQRWIHVLEHDRASSRFEWTSATSVPPMATEVAALDGRAARLRVSISTRVDPAICPAPAESFGLDIHVALDRPRLGAVKADATARAVAAEVSSALQEHVAGRDYTTLHVFAATPVSVSVLLGQVLSSSVFPPAEVYNFTPYPCARYNWSVLLPAALAGEEGAAIRLEHA